MTQPLPLSAPTEPMIGAYKLHHELGEGTFAKAYLAEAPADGRLVVLKVAHKYDTLVGTGYRQEFQHATRLRHPHLGETLDHGLTGAGRPFLVMAYHAGAPLGQTRGQLPEAEVARLGWQLARGLAAIHAEGLVHRDVTPANVLVEPSGHARLIDFGMLAPAPAHSRGGEGTPLYMAPEALRAEPVDARADLYSLGAILYRLASGRAPFEERGPDQLLAAALSEHPEPLAARAPQVSQALSALVMKLLAKEPADRPESARDVAHQLARLAGEGTPWIPGDGSFAPQVAWAEWEASGASPGVVAFVGEPGAGRTRAVREAFAHLRRMNAPAVLLSAEPGEGPFGLVERLWRWAAAHAPEAANELPRPLRAVVAALWPWAYPEAKPSDDPARLSRVLPQALAMMLRRAGGGGPLAIMIDDWDQVDAASRGLLTGAWANVLREFHWLLATEHPVKGAETLALLPFNAEEARVWVTSVAETDEAEGAQLAARLFEASRGNPGWMSQALAHLAATGGLGRGGREAPAMPASAEAMLEATWNRLNREQRGLVEALAVFAQPFAQGDLEPIAGVLPGTWPLELGGLVARGVLTLAGGRFRFAHGWWAAWITDRMPEARQARLAADIARALESHHGLGGPVPDGDPVLLHRIAVLYEESDAPEALVKYAQAAGRATARVWANEAALEHFAAGLAAIERHPEPWRFRVPAQAMRHAQADVRRVVGELAPAAATYEAALEDATSPLERARLLVSLGKCRQMLNTLPEARGVLEDALRVLEPLDDVPDVAAERARCYSTLGRVRFYAGEREHSRKLYEACLAVARKHELRGYEAEALSFLGTLLAGSADTAETGLAYLGEALGLREADGDPLGRLDTHMLIGNAFMGLGRFNEAREHFEANRAVAAEVGYRQEESLALLNLGLCDAEQGRWRDALGRLEAAAEIGQAIGYGFMLGFARYAESVARLHLGDPTGMEAALSEAREREASLGSPYLRQYGLAYEAERHLFLGAFEQARRAAELAVAAIEKSGGGELLLKARLLLAEARIHGGELDEGARELKLARAGIADSGAAAPMAQAERLAGWLAYRREQLGEARAAWERGLAIAKSEALEGLEADLILALHLVDRRLPGDPGQMPDLGRAYAIAERHRTPEPLALACLGLALQHLGSGEELLAERLSRRGHDLLARFTEALPSAGARANFQAHPLRQPFCEAGELEEAHRQLRRGRRLEMLLDLAKAIGASRHPDGVLARVRTFSKEFTHAERCLVLLTAPGSKDLRPWNEAPGVEETYSRSIVARVIQSREPECVLDTRASEALQTQASIVDMQLKSVMCVPLLVEQALHGVLYVDSRVALGAFGPEDLRMLEAVAAQAAIALDSARLFQAMRKQTEQAQAQLRLLQEKDSTIAGMRDFDEARTAAFEAESHDLRAPLAAISAGSQGLLKGLDGELSAGQRERVEGILLSARMLTRKIDGILDAAGAQAGKLTLRLQDLALLTIVEEIVRGLEPSAEAKGLSLSIDAASFQGLPVVRADERRVGQMIQNLIDNAIKYTDQGGVTVAAHADDMIRLVVADSGPGFPEARLVAPFERYGARTAKVPGSGVGLWRVKSLMDQHGGDVGIASSREGTRITLAFPIWPSLGGENSDREAI